jgi:hypothetical protein
LASPQIADAFAAQDRTRQRRTEEEAEEVVSALLLTCVVIRSVASSQRAPPPVPVAVTAFDSCMLTMRAVRGAVVRVYTLQRKAGASVVDGPLWHWPLLDDRQDLHHRRGSTPLLC